MPLDHLGRILQGGAETARLAGVTIVGGHTIDDPEPKYGMAVTGIVKPGEQLTNAAARPGDYLVLTKPLGTGVIATAVKRGDADQSAVVAATESMAALNKDGSEAALAHRLKAITDITGFGLLGHLGEMCRASRASAEIWFDRLPLLPGAEALVRDGVAPGGTRRNLESPKPAPSSTPRWSHGSDFWPPTRRPPGACCLPYRKRRCPGSSLISGLAGRWLPRLSAAFCLADRPPSGSSGRRRPPPPVGRPPRPDLTDRTNPVLVDYSRKWWVLAAVMVGTFMSPLDSSIVNVALPTLGKAFNVPITSVEWVVVAYLMG